MCAETDRAQLLKFLKSRRMLNIRTDIHSISLLKKFSFDWFSLFGRHLTCHCVPRAHASLFFFFLQRAWWFFGSLLWTRCEVCAGVGHQFQPTHQLLDWTNQAAPPPLKHAYKVRTAWVESSVNEKQGAGVHIGWGQGELAAIFITKAEFERAHPPEPTHSCATMQMWLSFTARYCRLHPQSRKWK